MSIWLTPDLRPIFGGTYFPPDDRYYNRPGFKTVLNAIAERVRFLDLLTGLSCKNITDVFNWHCMNLYSG